MQSPSFHRRKRTQALQGLVDHHAQSYVDTTKHALALQQRARRDHEYSSPGIEDLRAVVENELPGNIRDMRGLVSRTASKLFRNAFEAATPTCGQRTGMAMGPETRISAATVWSSTFREQCRNRLRFGPETSMPLPHTRRYRAHPQCNEAAGRKSRVNGVAKCGAPPVISWTRNTPLIASGRERHIHRALVWRCSR